MSLSWKCPECGLDFDTISPRDAVLAVRTFPRRYRALLTHFDPDEDVDDVIRRRPAPDVWSALEYTAHVAEVLDLLAPVIRQIEIEDNPHLYFFDSDKQAEEQSYNDWPLLRVIGDLESACADLSAAIEFVDPVNWSRRGTFDWGEREAIDMARNAVHEGAHHLRDVERVLTQVRGRPTAEDW
ncbi:MAG: DinB family protein [Acidimicrobiales bacterium]